MTNIIKFPTENEHQNARQKFVLFDELKDSVIKDEVVESLLGAGETSCWFGKPGDAKSVLLEDLGLHVACGRPCHSRKVRSGAVVYVALERHKLVERRATPFRLKHGIKNAPFAIVNGVYDLRDPKMVAELIEVIGAVADATGQHFVLIIIDTVARALCGGDENSPKDMGGIVNATSVLQASISGTHIALIHHTPIDGSERMRGHSSLLGAVDLTVHVSRNGDLRTARIDKSNDVEQGVVTAFKLESVVVGNSKDGKPTTAPIVVPVEDATGLQAPKHKQLPKGAEIALRALSDMIIDHGIEAPASNYIPADKRVVDIDLWRQHAYRRNISASDQPRAKQQAFARAVETLIAARRVATYDDKVWITS